MDWIGHVLRLNFACADSKHQQLSNFVWQSSEKLKDGTHSLNRAFVAAYILAGIQDSQYCAFTKTLGCGHLSRPIINNYSQQLFNIFDAIFQKQNNRTIMQINKEKNQNASLQLDVRHSRPQGATKSPAVHCAAIVLDNYSRKIVSQVNNGNEEKEKYDHESNEKVAVHLALRQVADTLNHIGDITSDSTKLIEAAIQQEVKNNIKHKNCKHFKDI
jgi:hypothetical protein